MVLGRGSALAGVDPARGGGKGKGSSLLAVGQAVGRPPPGPSFPPPLTLFALPVDHGGVRRGHRTALGQGARRSWGWPWFHHMATLARGGPGPEGQG